jgi:ABC-2 type transport system ATP-binding protein
VWGELQRLRDDGRTLLVTTQYVGEAESCDRVALLSGGRLIALEAPEALRRMAMGGDTVDVETAEPFDWRALQGLGPVRSVEQVDARRLRVTVDDAATALPDVVEAIRARNGDVTLAQEVRPSFDDVFAILVERDRADNGAGVDPAREAAA